MKALAVTLLVMGMAFAHASPAWATETFGVESFASSIVSNEAGTPATQAGSHPYAMTTSIVFNHVVTAMEEPPRVRTYGDPKDIEVNLPRGVIVNPRATEVRCTEAELESGMELTGCPNASAVGVFSVYLDGLEILDEPVYNMASPAGVPAELGFDAAGIGLIMHVGGRVRTGGDYGMSADISEISDEHPIYSIELTLWGDPSAASHDDERGTCADEKAKQIFEETGVHKSCPVERTTKPFLTLPASCTGESLTTTVSTDSWQESGALNPDGSPNLSDPRWQTASSSSPPLTGCPSLDFNPRLTVSTSEPEAAHAEAPSGLNVDLKLPAEESVDGVADADLKEAAVTLPAGFAISPSAAAGREACTPAKIELGNAKAPACPEASKVGSAKIVTPLVEDPLEGSLYLAQPYENVPSFGSPEHPGGSLLAAYLVVEADGVLIKLAGKVQADAQTGQLTIARDTGGVRLLRSPEQAHAVERHARGDADREPRNRLRARRRRVPQWALQPRVHSRHAQQRGGGVERVHAAALAPGRRTALRRLHGEITPRSVGNHQRRRSLPGTAGIDRGLSAILGDRHSDCRRGAWGRSALPPRAGPAGERDLSDRSLPRRSLRAQHRRTGNRGAV
jgi:hypothetical protein